MKKTSLLAILLAVVFALGYVVYATAKTLFSKDETGTDDDDDYDDYDDDEKEEPEISTSDNGREHVFTPDHAEK